MRAYEDLGETSSSLPADTAEEEGGLQHYESWQLSTVILSKAKLRVCWARRR